MYALTSISNRSTRVARLTGDMHNSDSNGSGQNYASQTEPVEPSLDTSAIDAKPKAATAPIALNSPSIRAELANFTQAQLAKINEFNLEVVTQSPQNKTAQVNKPARLIDTKFQQQFILSPIMEMTLNQNMPSLKLMANNVADKPSTIEFGIGSNF